MPHIGLCCTAALPAVEVKSGRRKSKSAEQSKHPDEDEDTHQFAKCYFDLKVTSVLTWHAVTTPALTS